MGRPCGDGDVVSFWRGFPIDDPKRENRTTDKRRWTQIEKLTKKSSFTQWVEVKKYMTL
jgi:hypothetical protein